MKRWKNKPAETTTERFTINRNRFEDYDDERRNRDNNLSSQPLAKISFGIPPYPAGNSNMK